MLNRFSRKSNTITTDEQDNLKKDGAMAKKVRRKGKGALEYISPKNRKKAKAIIRELGLEFLSAKKVEKDE